jgi:hypothetical protein
MIPGVQKLLYIVFLLAFLCDSQRRLGRIPAMWIGMVFLQQGDMEDQMSFHGMWDLQPIHVQANLLQANVGAQVIVAKFT